MLRRFLIVMMLAGLAVPVVASPCWACTCAGSGDPEADRHAQAESADLVFTGRAKSQTVDEGDPDFTGDEQLRTRFRVRKVYKGHPGKWVTIHSYANGAACGYQFEDEHRYTVFAYKDNKDRYKTDACSGTKRGGINPERYGLD